MSNPCLLSSIWTMLSVLVDRFLIRSTSDFRAAVSDYERQLLEDALKRNRFNQRATAVALGLSYDHLRHALKRHRLQDES